MVGHQRVSDEQWEFLLSFMERHPWMARGTPAYDWAHSKLPANRLWEELAASLNDAGSGHPKSVSEWRNYWKRQRCDVRRKACERRATSSKMDSTPLPRHLVLTDREERILKVLGPVTVFGFEFVRLPYSEEDPNTSASANLPRPTEMPPAADSTRVLSSATAHEEPVAPSIFCTTSLDKPRPARPDRSQTPRTRRPVPVSRPYRRFAVPPDCWSMQIAKRGLRIAAKRAHYAKQLLAIEERHAKAAEKSNEIMTLILGVMTKIAQSFKK